MEGGGEPDVRGRWSRLTSTLAVGLIVAACLCLTYAVIRRVPGHPLLLLRDDVTSVLWHTAGVVAVAVMLCAVFAFVVDVSRRRTPDHQQRNAVLLGCMSAILGLSAVFGLWLRWRDDTVKLFNRAEQQQVSLDGVRVVEIASVAWICACLAMAALAVAAATREAATAAADRGAHRAVLSALIVLVVAGVATLSGHRPTVDSVTAAPPPDPPPVNVDGNVAWEIPTEKDFLASSASLAAIGGPGLVRIADTKHGPGRVEGISGISGDTVWSFNRPHLGLVAVAIGGGGPDSVAVVSGQYRGYPVLIGLDADTGTPMWSIPDSDHLIRQRRARPEVSPSVVLTTAVTRDEAIEAQEAVPWTAVSLRSGHELWSVDIPYACSKNLSVSESYVLTPNCDGDAIVDVRDARTGLVQRTLHASDISVKLGPGDMLSASGIIETDLIVAAVWNYGDDTPGPIAEAVVDASDGRVMYSAPAGTEISMLDPRSIITSDVAGLQTLVDLESGATIDTGLSTAARHFVDGVGDMWARVGDQWVTLVPAPGEESKTLKSFRHGAPMTTRPSPCTGDLVPRVSTVSGALLVNCGDRLVGIR